METRPAARTKGQTQWPRELDLLVACCRWPPSPAREAAVSAAHLGAIDWERFERLARAHRVVPLAADGLKSAGIDPPETLAKLAARHSRREIAMARLSLYLQQTFDRLGIDAILVKGAALAQLAYGRLGIKYSNDVDLLVAPADVPAAWSALEDLGYHVIAPRISHDKVARFVTLAKEAVFVHSNDKHIVELHWALTDNNQLLGGLGGAPELQTVAIGPGAIRTLADVPLFAYLCVHGTWHGWARLKWIADLAAFLSHRDGAAIAALHDQAVRLGAGRAPGVALLLCRQLFDTPLPDSLTARLAADRHIAALVATAQRCIARVQVPGAEAVSGLDQVRLNLAMFRLVPGFGFAISHLRHNWTSEADRLDFDLPRGLGFLYHIMRLPLFAVRRAKYALRGGS